MLITHNKIMLQISRIAEVTTINLKFLQCTAKTKFKSKYVSQQKLSLSNRDYFLAIDRSNGICSFSFVSFDNFTRNSFTYK